MKIQILHLLEGAEQAEGLTVIIDVFRAFSAECYMYGQNARKVILAGEVEEAFRLAEEIPDSILAGERNGIKIEGFRFGNSPSEIVRHDLSGLNVIHTTSAGVQGVVAASGADEIITGALVNAKAAARYIRSRDPEIVSLVCMGWNAKKDTEEDVLCAEYIRSLLEGNPIPDIARQALDLRLTEGKKFFDPAQKNVFPEEDFWLCTKPDIFDHVIRIIPNNGRLETEWIFV